MPKIANTLVMAMLAVSAPLCADEELDNQPIVAAGWRGECYAKSVPADGIDDAGTTTLYRVESGADVAIETYPWYARNIHVWCPGWPWEKATVVRVATWPRGILATDEELAVAFYRDGKLLRRYSTLDIAGKPEAVLASISHHRVFDSVEGIVWEGNDWSPEFRATGIHGEALRFALIDGRRVTDAVKVDVVVDGCCSREQR
jgi:hypothetical protein